MMHQNVTFFISRLLSDLMKASIYLIFFFFNILHQKPDGELFAKQHLI